MIVLDASAALELLLGTEGAAAVRHRISSPDVTLHAPHLLDLEIAQVLRRYCSNDGLKPQRALEALEDLRALDVHRYPHEPMLARIWELRANLTAYDAAYVALAETLGASLLTFDARLAAAPRHAARVELLR
jgi:predicted nucleic acid-binding protein